MDNLFLFTEGSASEFSNFSKGREEFFNLIFDKENPSNIK